MGGLRKLIVNADDLGYTPLTSAGILAAWRGGIVTSASLMVRRPDAADAARQAAAEGFTDLGLHLDLGEWTCRGGQWRQLYEVVRHDNADAVKDECERQLDRFRELVGRIMAGRLGIALRDASATIAYEGGFYGQHGDGHDAPECLTEEAILGILARARAGCVELGCHPGLDPDLETMYCHERSREVEVLCAPGLRERIAAAGFVLTTFTALGPQPAPEAVA
jgi:predicted glycoside hydrolase/deacetylase ChbG (UPF0249 family)